MLERLPDKFNALIVGASRGIGLALVEALCTEPRCGQVFAACREPEQADALHAAARGDCRVRAVRADVTDAQSLDAARDQIETHARQLHLLIVTAGLLHDGPLQPERRLEDLNAAAAVQSFRVNALGPLLVAQQMLPLLTHDAPAVFASLSARVGSISDNRLGGWYSYRASKAAQNQYLKTLAIELARRAKNLQVAVLHPGTVDTGLSQPFQGSVPADRLFSPERAARQLLQVIDGLDASGRFLAWDGGEIPW